MGFHGLRQRGRAAARWCEAGENESPVAYERSTIITGGPRIDRPRVGVEEVDAVCADAGLFSLRRAARRSRS